MTFEEFSAEMHAYREAAIREGEAAKEMSIVADRLKHFYGRFDASERSMANRIIDEWVLSQDESKQFDAVALIRRQMIRAAIPALRELLPRLQNGTGLDPDWARVVEKLISDLNAHSEPF